MKILVLTIAERIVETRENGNSVQCGTWDWVLEQKENISGKTHEIQINSVLQLLYLYQG